METEDIVELAKKEFFWFHRHPELSEEEFETTKRVKTVLGSHGIVTVPLSLKTGTVVQLGNGNGPVVALRCDMDALPIQEETGLPYASEIPGKMHGCGHDFHTATLLGIALTLKDVPIDGTVKLVFQPAEENAAGALSILKTGVLDDVDVIFGLHCSAVYPRGTIITRPGFMNGAVDTFRITFSGKGAHACRPYQSIDPVVMSAQYVTAAQTVVSRNLNPFHAALVSITHIEAGKTDNVIPASGFVEGTVRTLDPGDRKHIRKRLETMAIFIAESFGGEAVIHWHEGPPATNNTEKWVEFAKQIAGTLKLPFAPAPDSLSGEDFAFYQQTIPGAFIQIGTGISPMNHNPAFRVDPETLHESIAFGSALVLAALEKLKKKRGQGSD